MLFAKRIIAVATGAVLAGSASWADAPRKSETEVLIPPQGGAFDLPLHANAVCILSFPTRVGGNAFVSARTYQIKPWGDDGTSVAVLAPTESVAPATVAIASADGSIKVNVTLHVVADTADAFTLVRFKAATAEEAFETAVGKEVAKRTAAMEQELGKLRRSVDVQVKDRAESLIALRGARRLDVFPLESHERNGAQVVVHVMRGAVIGDEGYVFFDVQNRSSNPYRLATVHVTASGHEVGGAAVLADTRDAADMIGVVAPGTTAHGSVVVPSLEGIVGKSLVLEIAEPDGRGRIRLARGIVIR